MLKDYPAAGTSPSYDPVDVERRRALGIYYTPNDAAKLLAEWAIRTPVDSVLEPSFGGCSFLAAAKDRLEALGAASPARQMFGYDVDPKAFVYLARTLTEQRTTNFRLQDFLKSRSTGKDLVTTALGNPPFVSYHRMNPDQRAVLDVWRGKNAAPFPKSASLWAYFLIHSLAFLKPDGRLAFILPSAFCTADYARPISNYLTQVFRRVLVFAVRDQLFLHAGARERTVVLLADRYRPDVSASQTKAEVHAVHTLDELSSAIRAIGRHGESHRIESICAPGLDETIGNRNAFCELGEFASVSIGEVVGDTEFFVKPSHAWDALGIPSHYLYSIVTKGKQLPGILLKKGDIKGRYSVVPLLLRAEGKRLSKAVAKYLDSYPAHSRATNRTFQKRDPWHLTSYRTDAAAFIGSLSQLAPRMVLNQAKVSCANGLYQLRPLRGMRWSPAIAVASLSTVWQVSAERTARSRGTGALKLEPSDAKRLLIPRTALEMSYADGRRLVSDVDRVYREHGFAAAARHVDYALLLQPKILTHRQLTNLQDELRRLRGLRLPKT